MWFRRFWRRQSHATAPAHRPPLVPETIALIREMAAANRLWGAERIRGELLKLDIRVAKSTIQKYIRQARPPRRSGQTWATFLRNHAHDIWAADFLPVTDLLFRPLYAFFVIALGSRRVIHVGVTCQPTDAWVAQQLREATGFGQRPTYLLHDNVGQLHTAYRAPMQNAMCERFLGSVRRECLDHLLVLGEAHLRRILREYVAYFNTARPHQGLRQRVPDAAEECAPRAMLAGSVRVVPILGGLHQAYARVA